VDCVAHPAAIAAHQQRTTVPRRGPAQRDPSSSVFKAAGNARPKNAHEHKRRKDRLRLFVAWGQGVAAWCGAGGLACSVASGLSGWATLPRATAACRPPPTLGARRCGRGAAFTLWGPNRANASQGGHAQATGAVAGGPAAVCQSVCFAVVKEPPARPKGCAPPSARPRSAQPGGPGPSWVGADGGPP
ncbi:unnamed protein product, partial [Amoebophrya sp. A120]